MANLSKTRTVFAFTSPRTIEKIIPEIQILIEALNGKEWNSNTQEDFFDKLYSSEFYEGDIRPTDPALAARDRITRAPKALGFVDLKPTISITQVGANLLNGKRINEVIAKQLFKFQLPSPFHKVPPDRNFNVRPYLELLRLVKVLGNLSKTEIALFFVQITNYNKFDEVVESIKQFRTDIKASTGNRKAFIEKRATSEILKIYAEEIEKKEFKTRESPEVSLRKFIATKRSNLIDYADAFIRYLRSTQLISFDNKTFRLIIAPSKVDEVDYILNKIERKAIAFTTERHYKEYLFSASSLSLLTDDKVYIENKLHKLNIEFDVNLELEALKDLLEYKEAEIIEEVIAHTELSLKHYQEFDDIVDVFAKIIKKDVPDPPLYLEWNIWRSLVMMNYAKNVIGNFRLDLDGVPLNTALGNLPDILAEYDGFKLQVEVTMSSGNKQYEMEGEPVARHFGKIQNESSDPVYCLFIAPKISEGALAHFFNLNRFNTRAYGGKTRIVPMSLNQFIMFITIAKDKGFDNSIVLKNYLDGIILNNLSIDDEVIWYQKINESITTWVN